MMMLGRIFIMMKRFLTFCARFKLKASVSSALYCLTEKLNEQDKITRHETKHISRSIIFQLGSYLSPDVDMLIADQA